MVHARLGIAEENSGKLVSLIRKEAKKIAVDKLAKKEADEVYKKAIEQAKQVRDEAMRKFR